MLPISYLNNRQIGKNIKSNFRISDFRLNTDFLLSRLTCHTKDVYITHGEETDVPPFACKFRRDSQSDLLAVANEDGFISLYDTSEGCSNGLLKIFTAHNNAVFDISWLPDKCQLISGSGDHHAFLWDIMTCKRISSFRKHTASIKSIDVCHQQSAIFATGSRDGTINVWDTRMNNSVVNHKPAVVIHQAHCRKNLNHNKKKQMHSDSFTSVSSVAFQDDNYLASSGVADGVVKIWDLRKTYVSHPKYSPMPKHQMKYSDSKRCTSLVFDSAYKNLYACSTGHKIYKFDCHSYSVDTIAFEGFQCSTYFVKLAISSDDQYLLCGSSDHKAYIWKTSKPGLPILQLPGHNAEVTSVTWSPYNNTKLATCGDDNRVLVWNVANLENVNPQEIYSNSAPYSGCPKSTSPVSSNSETSLMRNSSSDNNSSKKSSVEDIHTPIKPPTLIITSFFSPVISSSVPSSSKYAHKDCDTKLVLPAKLPTNSPVESSPSQILTPSNHSNKSNILHSPESNLENSPSPVDKSIKTLSSSSDIQNKENAESDSSPDSLNYSRRLGQTKRKSTVPHCTPKLKKIHSNNKSKTKGSAKVDKKTKVMPGRTIMNYFSVMSPEN